MIYALTYFLISSLSFATISNFSVTGASKTYDNGTTDLYEVFGGYDSTCAGTDTTCDTCGSGALGIPASSCNVKAVGPATEVSISFKSDKNVQNYFIITRDVDTINQFKKSTSQIAGNQTGTLTVTWNELCTAQDSANAACATDVNSQIFRVGLDVNNDDKLDNSDDYKRVRFGNFQKQTTGVSKLPVCADDPNTLGLCDYAMYPGDEKAYLLSYNYSAGFPLAGSSPIIFTAIRLYQAELASIGDSCETATYSFSRYKELSLSKSGTAFTANVSGEAEIAGLTNDVAYCFRSAVVDKAGNVRGFTSTVGLDNIESKVEPSRVIGLLEEGNCFIATAAYGNPLADKIDTFRDFRDEVLLKFSFGQKLVSFYYQNSKPLAIEIFKHPWAQSVTKYILWPIWFVIEVVLNYPIALVLMGLALIATSRRRENVI